MKSTQSKRHRDDVSKARSLTASRIVTPDGRFNVVRLGTRSQPWRDLYHALLTLSWVPFLGLVTCLYLVINIIFAIAYLAGGDGIENARPGSFADAFFFSVQTMASIGYGAMHPRTTYVNIIVTIEALVGLVSLAMATGLMFARFSRPTARLLFSESAVIAPYNGVPTLMVRTANQRRNRILEAEMRMVLVQNATSSEGETMRRFYDLVLVRSRTPIFALSWTGMHPINADSPLFEKTAADLSELEAEIVVTLTGIDETFSQTIHARYSYLPTEILWNARFVDIFERTPEGRMAIDYSRFHQVMPLESKS